ncbi:MAG: hypothetical protein L3K07_00870, partial [Thermoplasmata archaeon]|nr:hypothetical protein [Thermoplasmata archaeon]
MVLAFLATGVSSAPALRSGPPTFLTTTLTSPFVSADTEFGINGTASGSSGSLLVVQGDTLVVFVASHSSATVHSVSDSLRNGFHAVGAGAYYVDANGPERLSVFAAYNLSGTGFDSVSVSTSTYSWTVVTVVEVTGVAATPLDAVASPSNSSQPGMNPSTVSSSIAANASDLVLLGLGVRGTASISPVGSDQLVQSGTVPAGFNAATGAALRQTQ